MIIKPENPQHLINFLKAAPLVLYGMGGAGMRIAKWCDENKIDYIFADRDAEKKQQLVNNVVVSPHLLEVEYKNANIVISSIIYFDEIKKELLKLGVNENRIVSYNLFMPQDIVWSDLDENIDWDLMRFRVEMFSEWITSEIRSVSDYGAGKMFLQEYLNSDVKYFPIDYIRRNEQTILCDLNLGEFPEIQTDATVCSGVLEFIHTAEKLLEHVCRNTNKMVILSYLTADQFPNIEGRRASAYVSDLTDKQIVDLMESNNFYLEKKLPDPINKACTVYLFKARPNMLLNFLKEQEKM